MIRSQWLQISRWLPLLLTGCALGQGNYGCPANRDGVRCLSTREVYQQTHQGKGPPPTQIKNGKIINPPPVNTSEQTLPVTRESLVIADLSDSKVPIRTAAHIMRIWIAPWEDQQGDLVLSGYVYTEIEPRRWRVGLTPAKINNSLTPLKASQNQEKKL